MVDMIETTSPNKLFSPHFFQHLNVGAKLTLPFLLPGSFSLCPVVPFVTPSSSCLQFHLMSPDGEPGDQGLGPHEESLGYNLFF